MTCRHGCVRVVHLEVNCSFPTRIDFEFVYNLDPRRTVRAQQDT